MREEVNPQPGCGAFRALDANRRAGLPEQAPEPHLLMPCIPRDTRLLALFVVALGRAAAFGFTDNFDDGNDTGWTRYSPLAPFGGGASYSYPSGAYHIEAPISPVPEVLGPQRAGSVRADQIYTRTRAAVDITAWSTNMNQSVGLIARVTDLGLGSTKGYTFNYNSFSGYFQLNLVLNEAAAKAIDESPWKLDPSKNYRLVFTLVGSNILGQAFAPDNLAVPLHSVFSQDDSYPSGSAGVFAYALTALGGIDARFDTYEASAATEPVRATALSFSPHPGESPVNPIDTLTVRLADIETTLNPGSIRLEVDGAPATSLDITPTPPTTLVTWMPPTVLDPSQSHTAKVTFSDGTGPQSFEWHFGAPAAPTAATLVVASRPEGPYTTDATAILDAANRRFTILLQPEPRYFRMQDTVARTLKSMSLTGGKAVVTYE